MSQDHRLQRQRFELKYLIREGMTPPMREYLRCYLELDDFATEHPNHAYPVHSIYLDSVDLMTHRSTVNGNKNRFKLRLRYYDDRPNTPVFFEVKARVDNCILKQRCGVKREAVTLLGAGQLPDPSMLMSDLPRHLAALQRFNELLLRLNAKPKAHNTYTREAWVSPNDNSVRVTFDRGVQIEPYFKFIPVVEMTNPVIVFPGWTILEIKFTDRFPNWLRDFVRHFCIMRSASAKYSHGVEVIGEHVFHDGYRTWDWGGEHPYAELAVAQTPGHALIEEDPI
jgi:SPX domain protein involved in polyphosphate accumulation